MVVKKQLTWRGAGQWLLHISMGATCLVLVDRHTESLIKRNRTEVVKLYSRMEVGMTKASAVSLANSNAYFKVHETTGTLWVKSPLIFGSLNWNIILSVQNLKITKIAIRDDDQPGLKPPGAPPDKAAR